MSNNNFLLGRGRDDIFNILDILNISNILDIFNILNILDILNILNILNILGRVIRAGKRTWKRHFFHADLNTRKLVEIRKIITLSSVNQISA